MYYVHIIESYRKGSIKLSKTEKFKKMENEMKKKKGKQKAYQGCILWIKGMFRQNVYLSKYTYNRIIENGLKR